MIAPRPGPGVCRRCFNLTEGYGWCWSCAHGGHCLDAVVPISYSVSGGALHAMLAGYKRTRGPHARGLEMRLAAVLWRYLELHERCIARAASVDRFDLVTTVPSSDWERDARHPLRRVVGQLTEPVNGRYRRLLRRSAVRSLPRAFDVGRFEICRDPDGASILLIDDTWTTGANAAKRRRRAEGRGRACRGRGGHRSIPQRGLAGQPSRASRPCLGRFGGSPVRLRAARLAGMWWDNAVIYQVYLRSFQDSDGDGVGDLPGATARLEHIAKLGADAVWLSPVYPSPNADFGYDVSDFRTSTRLRNAGRPRRADRPRPRPRAQGRCSTSCPATPRSSTPGFASTPSTTSGPTRSPTTGARRSAAPRGSSTRRAGRYYLSSFFPEQADLDWHNPRCRGRDGGRAALLGATAGSTASGSTRWTGSEGPRAARRAARARAAAAAAGSRTTPSSSTCTRATRPASGPACEAIREAVGDALLVGEVFLPTARARPVPRALDVVLQLRDAVRRRGRRALTRGDRRRAQRRGVRAGCSPTTTSTAWPPGPAPATRAPCPAAALAARAGVHLPGRRARDGQRRPAAARAGSPRARRAADADALGRERARGLHHRHPVAEPPTSPRSERVGAGGRPPVDALARARRRSTCAPSSTVPGRGRIAARRARRRHPRRSRDRRQPVGRTAARAGRRAQLELEARSRRRRRSQRDPARTAAGSPARPV